MHSDVVRTSREMRLRRLGYYNRQPVVFSRLILTRLILTRHSPLVTRHSALSSLISANRRLIAWQDVSCSHKLR
jgi:hypothetical protein